MENWFIIWVSEIENIINVNVSKQIRGKKKLKKLIVYK